MSFTCPQKNIYKALLAVIFVSVFPSIYFEKKNKNNIILYVAIAETENGCKVYIYWNIVSFKICCCCDGNEKKNCISPSTC